MDLGLAGRVFIVTGGSSGIGLSVVKTLLSEGAAVGTCARSAERLREATASLDNRACLATAADVCDEDAMLRLVDSTVERFGRLDGVAAIAGHGLHGHALEISIDEWRGEITAKLGSLLNIVRAARPHLQRSDAARIVTLTSPSARDPDPEMAAVSAARAALANLTRALALDLASEGIIVNAVAVGLIDSPRQIKRHQQSASDLSYARWLEAQAERRRIPLRRTGSADEVARLVVVALSRLLSYTTGAVLDITGGLPGP